MKLFAVVLGGRADGCNTELHDVVFVIGKSIEDTYPQLREKWFGNKKRLHIDSIAELNYVDGHEVVISKEKPAEDKKIFFVNFGGYKKDFFGEKHEVNFYVAANKPEVLAKAKKDLCLDHIEPHCDDNLPIDDIFSIHEIDHHYVHLIPRKDAPTFSFKSEYRRLDNPTV